MKKRIAICLCLTLFLSGCSLDQIGGVIPTAAGTEQPVTSADDPAGTEPAETTTTASEAEESEPPSEEAGGNPDDIAVKEIMVTVSEDKYFVDNHEVSFDELTAEIQAEDGDAFVRIFDENATLNAFEKLKNYLEENDIEYELS